MTSEMLKIMGVETLQITATGNIVLGIDKGIDSKKAKVFIIGCYGKKLQRNGIYLRWNEPKPDRAAEMSVRETGLTF